LNKQVLGQCSAQRLGDLFSLLGKKQTATLQFGAFLHGNSAFLVKLIRFYMALFLLNTYDETSNPARILRRLLCERIFLSSDVQTQRRHFHLLL